MTVKELADRLGVRCKDVIAKGMARHIPMTVNSELDAQLARGLAEDLGCDIDDFSDSTLSQILDTLSSIDAHLAVIASQSCHRWQGYVPPPFPHPRGCRCASCARLRA